MHHATPLIPFKDLLTEHKTLIESYMSWENYDLNETIIPVTEKVKEHALFVLEKSYGRTMVESEIIDYLLNDVFIYFPVLLQQLSITRLIDAYGVAEKDEDTVETVRSEILSNEIDQTGKITQGTIQTESTELDTKTTNTGTVTQGTIQTESTELDTQSKNTGIVSRGTTQTDTNVLDTKTKNTGTVTTEDILSNSQNSVTDITNSSDVNSTGSHNVNLSHNMPEQSLDGTGSFPVDSQGTPILTNAYTQQANESFNTNNPIETSESSRQEIENESDSSNNSSTVNNLMQEDTGTTTRTTANTGSDNTENVIEDTGTTTRTTENSGSDNSENITEDTGTTTRTSENTGSDSSESLTASHGENQITETITSLSTNKQYAYEIKAFLETADSIVAFKIWQDSFSWIEGII